MSGRALSPVERTFGWMIGIPFASWRYLSRQVTIKHDLSSGDWPMAGFPEDAHEHPGEADAIQRPSAGCGAAYRRLYRVRAERPVLGASELMSIVCNDPNVACPLEIARFERQVTGALELGEEMEVRLPGPWSGPVRVVDLTDSSFRLVTLSGHMEAGEIEFRARNEEGVLVFEIESWARSIDRFFDFVYDRLGVARELQLDMWAFFLERVAQVSGGQVTEGIEIQTERCGDHPL